MIDFDEACRRVAALASPRGEERLRLDEACGRILAQPVIAARASPETAVSAMDGYAVRAADVADGAARLRLVGRAFAGDPPITEPLAPGACVRIFTGAPAPAGAERVVIQEEAHLDGEGVVVAAPTGAGSHLRAPGSDFRLGEVLVAAGARLTPQAMVAAAAADRPVVDVVVRPRVSVMSTGDELAEPGAARDRLGMIPESVSFGIAALTRVWGGEVVARRRVRDDLADLRRVARRATGEAHVVVVIGGASVGERDFAKLAFAPLGLELAFDKVAIKPGKPVWMGRVGETVVVGLPGNPSAAMLTARLFLAPLLAGMSGGAAADAWDWRTAKLAEPAPCCGDRETFQRAGAGREGVAPLCDQDSSGQKGLAATDVLIRRRPGASRLDAGEFVEVLRF
jgi:molybdopterin molybdotransferase